MNIYCLNNFELCTDLFKSTTIKPSYTWILFQKYINICNNLTVHIAFNKTMNKQRIFNQTQFLSGMIFATDWRPSLFRSQSSNVLYKLLKYILTPKNIWLNLHYYLTYQLALIEFPNQILASSDAAGSNQSINIFDKRNIVFLKYMIHNLYNLYKHQNSASPKWMQLSSIWYLLYTLKLHNVPPWTIHSTPLWKYEIPDLNRT